MKNYLLVAFLFLSLSLPAQIAGTWSGKIEIPLNELTFVLHIEDQEGTLKATADSPDQNAYGLTLDKITFVEDTLTITDSKTQIRYVGKLENPEHISGTFYQGGASFTLNLKRGDTPKRLRPQEPKAPFPYHAEEVSFSNSAARITLHGTLTWPQTKCPHPAVVLIAGSGPNNRDEEIMGHQPFAVLADFLSRNGYAVLRYDKRGVAASEGNYSTATTLDFAEDAAAAYAFLQTRKEINMKKAGLIGHSEGGIIAALLAAKNPKISFIALMAAPGVPLDQLLLTQKTTIEREMGVPELALVLNEKLFAQFYDILKKETSHVEALQELKAFVAAQARLKGMPESQFEPIYALSSSDWFRAFIRINPADFVQHINCKVLVLNGKKDVQVTWKENTEALIKAFPKKTKVTLKTYENLNHLFQQATTGMPDEYGTIEQTIDPIVLQDLINWLPK